MAYSGYQDMTSWWVWTVLAPGTFERELGICGSWESGEKLTSNFFFFFSFLLHRRLGWQVNAKA